MDTDEATAPNMVTTISDKIATRLSRTTAVDPTLRTQLARADQAYTSGNGDTANAGFGRELFCFFGLFGFGALKAWRMLLLLPITLVFAHACTFHVAEAASWCDDTSAFGDYTLAANDVCTLTTQITVTNGNTLSIIGEETESSTDLALITQNKAANNDAHRLFWVEWGALRLAWVAPCSRA